MTTTAYQDVASRYMSDTVETSGPGKLIVMLYDQLLADLATADAAFETGGIETIHRNLMHAWEMLRYMRQMLNQTIWDGATNLATLYTYFETEIMFANLHKDRARAQHVYGLISQLADAWRIAAERPVEYGATDAVGVG